LGDDVPPGSRSASSWPLHVASARGISSRRPRVRRRGSAPVVECIAMTAVRAPVPRSTAIRPRLAVQPAPPHGGPPRLWRTRTLDSRERSFTPGWHEVPRAPFPAPAAAAASGGGRCRSASRRLRRGSRRGLAGWSCHRARLAGVPSSKPRAAWATRPASGASSRQHATRSDPWTDRRSGPRPFPGGKGSSARRRLDPGSRLRSARGRVVTHAST